MTLMCNTWSNVFLQSMKTNPLSVKKLMKKLILTTLQELYAVSEISFLIRWDTPPTKVESLQFEFFFIFEIPQFFKFFNFALYSLFPSLFFINYIYEYVLYSIHVLLILQVDFSAKLMWSDPFPLYAKLNPVRSQILHVCSIWNSFKFFTLSLSAEEIVNDTLKYSYMNVWLLPLKLLHITRNTYLFTHDLTRSPPLSTWVTHVALREGPGARSSNFFGRAVFHLSYKYPLPFLISFLLRSTSLPRSSFPKHSATATSIVASEEELHYLDLVAVVLAPAVKIFPPPPP